METPRSPAYPFNYPRERARAVPPRRLYEFVIPDKCLPSVCIALSVPRVRRRRDDDDDDEESERRKRRRLLARVYSRRRADFTDQLNQVGAKRGSSTASRRVSCPSLSLSLSVSPRAAVTLVLGHNHTGEFTLPIPLIQPTVGAQSSSRAKRRSRARGSAVYRGPRISVPPVRLPRRRLCHS